MKFWNYTLPNNWTIKPIGEICQFSKKTKEFNNLDKIPFFPMETIPENGICVKTLIYKQKKEIGSGTFVRKGDIVVAKITPSFENGKQGIIDIQEDYAYATTEVISFCELDKISDKFFLFYVLKHPLIRSTLAGKMEGSTGRQRLSKEVFGSYEIPVPPLKEQRKIAKILSLVQDAIAQQEQLIALTTELKKSLTKKLFTEGTRGEPQKMTEIGLIPESWDVLPLEKTGDVIYGIQASVANNIDPIGTKIITNKNITLDGEFDFEKQSYFEIQTERHRKTILKKGDILFNWRSGSKEHVGKTAYFDIDGEYIHSSFILRIRPYPEINGRYLFNYLRWLRESGYFIKKQTYAINAKFNKSAVDLLPTLLPPREEQDHVASTLDLISEKINQHRAKLNTLQDLFQNLLHQLMTAQIRVDDLDLSALELELGEGGE